MVKITNDVTSIVLAKSPEVGSNLAGLVFRDPRNRADGTLIRTSRVVEINKRDQVLTTKNGSVYRYHLMPTF